jgi:predicted Zn-ribbon and HTH transcriptional regulator
MKKEDIEHLMGESMEDMGLNELVESRECEDCGHLLDDDNRGTLCPKCKKERQLD